MGVLKYISLFHTPTGSAHRSVRASLVSLKDALIGWSASDYDAPIQLWRIQIYTGYTLPSPSWLASPTWCKQKAFPLPGTAALWVFWKSREFPAFFRGPWQSYARPHGTWNSLEVYWLIYIYPLNILHNTTLMVWIAIAKFFWHLPDCSTKSFLRTNLSCNLHFRWNHPVSGTSWVYSLGVKHVKALTREQAGTRLKLKCVDPNKMCVDPRKNK